MKVLLVICLTLYIASNLGMGTDGDQPSLACPKNSYYEIKDKKPICRCTQNTYGFEDKCVFVCPSGTYKSDGMCVSRCPEGTTAKYHQDGACHSCRTGFTAVGDKCYYFSTDKAVQFADYPMLRAEKACTTRNAYLISIRSATEMQLIADHLNHLRKKLGGIQMYWWTSMQ